MFLSVTLSRNPELAEYAVHLHRTGQIRPNTYVLDLDTIRYNAQQLVDTAYRNGIHLYMMTKQLGRIPEVAQAITDSGITKAVAVDPWEALHLAQAGIALGNVGHLVQIPSSMVDEIVSCQPEVITVFSVEKAKEISDAAQKQGKIQDLLLKVVAKGDVVFEGQWGGFREEEVRSAVSRIRQLPGVHIAGVTSFPCFLFNGECLQPTENVHTLLRCAEMLETELGEPLKQINAPSATACATIPLLRQLGATHGEPGHALTGTTPLHQRPGQLERPAMVYVSEVSHTDGETAYVFGGGHYRRSHMKGALVGKSFPEMANRRLDATELAPESIDYYTGLKMDGQNVDVGDTALYSFRTQIFVTRAEVVVVEGLQEGHPTLVGVYDSLGKRLR
ncbi:YhfX family PLP-dependent enzyme [Melghirimyces algeriensis]|uniref:Predicted amino acid racemase n=1 Tax=Melghirimyces algeriensis TaxID=910412 RepID=A0A521DCW6_9BACL|nr:YhfX family PLP-dependent enzyme [Melghirimyces algeriensis]SMO68770.1 Predicted amino acid racemase [Melghirimyces algeriensis]